MMTTPYAALISDPALFASARNVDVRSRNRRIVYIAVFWLGAFVGAALSFHANIFAATLAVLGCKVAALVYIAFVKGDDARDTGVPQSGWGQEIASVGEVGSISP